VAIHTPFPPWNTSREEAGCGFPRRFAPRNDEDLDASRFLSRHDEGLELGVSLWADIPFLRPHPTSSLRGPQARGNPSADGSGGVTPATVTFKEGLNKSLFRKTNLIKSMI
jgi:hypothetical protein